MYNELSDACKMDDVVKVKRLLKYPGTVVNEIDSNGSTALIHAVLYKKMECIKLLLNHDEINVNHINKYGVSALMVACRDGSLEIVKLLMRHGATTSLENYKALKFAKHFNHKDIATYIENHIKLSKL